MDSSQIDLQNDQTFHLIRLPKETVDRIKETGSSDPVGKLIIYKEGSPTFHDSVTNKAYDLISNDNLKVRPNKHDLLELKPDKSEATHLGKIMPGTLITVPRK